ncbi:MAG: hypothetical protein ACYTGP_06200 [Planctomycetota bacterium]|jgi:hypothetical protein
MPEEQWVDPIVEEVRRARNAHASKFNYDLDAIFEDLRSRQESSGRQYVTHPPRRPSDTPKEGAA